MKSRSLRFETAFEAADDGELEPEEALVLAYTEGEERERVLRLADEKRRKQVGDRGTWIHNRNVNFTDVCVKECTFCSFSRDEGYLMSVEEVVEAGREARDRGATEVTVQGGINPELGLDYFLEVTRGLSSLGLHVHAFSPQEVHSLSRGSGLSLTEVVERLREAGLGSMPGTAAELLVPAVRQEICPDKIGAERWMEILREAHRRGIPSSSTMMYGHVETWEDRVRHLHHLRELQRETEGLTEFVPLPFVPGDTPLGREVGRNRADHEMVVALARLFLGPEVENVQASWVKLGRGGAVEALRAGANDVGGTLMDEKISNRAGSGNGRRLSPEELGSMIREAGMEPAQRDTLYRVI